VTGVEHDHPRLRGTLRLDDVAGTRHRESHDVETHADVAY
jgi:hypothetical protein